MKLPTLIMKYILLIILFSVMFFLNVQVPFTADDFTYGYASDGILMSINFALHQYMYWDGRIPTAFITSYLLQRNMNIIVFDIINSIMFVFLIFLISRVISKNKNITIFVIMLTTIVLSICIRDFGEVILWKTASVQYMWGVVIYIYLFDKYFRKSYFNAYDLILVFLVSFWLQNLTIIILLIIFSSIHSLYKKHQYKYIASYIIFTMGGLISLLSPGNFYRRRFVNDVQTSASDLVLINKILHFHIEILNHSGLFILSFIIFLMLVSLKGFNNVKIYDKAPRSGIGVLHDFFVGNIEFNGDSILAMKYFSIGFLFNYLMIIFPAAVWTDRTWFAGNVFMIIANLILINVLLGRASNYCFKYLYIFKSCFILITIVIFTYKVYDAYQFYYTYMLQTNQFMLSIKDNCNDKTIHEKGIKYKLYIINDAWHYSFTPDYQPFHLCNYINGNYYINKAP